MSRFAHLAFVTAILAVSATAAPAQVYPLTNGPNGGQSNTPDSARGWTGINSVAPERELLYHPERGGNAAVAVGAAPFAREDDAAGGRAPAPRRARHRRGRAHLR